MGYVDVAGVAHTLADGRVLFADVSFRVGEGAKIALVGPNGAGKTTLLRMVAGDIPVQEGVVARSGGLGVMRQFIGMIADDSTLTDLALSLAPPRVRAAGERLAAAARALHAAPGDERTQLRYAEAVAGGAAAGIRQVRALRLARSRTAGADRRSGGRRRGRFGVGTPGWVRVLARGPDGPAREAGGAPAALGRGAREAAPAHADVQAEGRVQLGDGVAVPGGGHPAAQVRGDRAAAVAAQGPGHPDAPRGRPYRQACRHARTAGVGRPHLPVRPGGLVRPPGRSTW